MKNYFKKSHAHKPKKGKGSYQREDGLTVEAIRQMQEEMEERGVRPKYIVLHGELVHIDNISDEELADKLKEHDEQAGE